MQSPCHCPLLRWPMGWQRRVVAGLDLLKQIDCGPIQHVGTDAGAHVPSTMLLDEGGVCACLEEPFNQDNAPGRQSRSRHWRSGLVAAKAVTAPKVCGRRHRTFGGQGLKRPGQVPVTTTYAGDELVFPTLQRHPLSESRRPEAAAGIAHSKSIKRGTDRPRSLGPSGTLEMSCYL